MISSAVWPITISSATCCTLPIARRRLASVTIGVSATTPHRLPSRPYGTLRVFPGGVVFSAVLRPLRSRSTRSSVALESFHRQPVSERLIPELRFAMVTPVLEQGLGVVVSALLSCTSWHAGG
jgi:hypothetical protein